MAGSGELDYPYEASDEASESELLERSLSVWKGWSCFDNEQFAPIPLDLHTASSIGQYDCVRATIERNEEDLNRRNKGGWTPLMYASYIGHDNIVNLLLDASINVNVKNFKGQTSLMLAASCGNESVAYFLLQAGAELESKDKKGWTALFHATYSGHQNMVKFLLDNGGNAEAVEPSREFTPFMEAATAGHEIIVQYFLQHGVNVNAKACSGDTARGLSLIHGHTKIVSLIDNHTVGTSHPLRSDAGLSFEEDLSSSDEAFQHPRRHSPRGLKARSKGPNIREGPEGFTRMYETRLSTKGQQQQGPPGRSNNSRVLTSVPRGYMTFKKDEATASGTRQIRYRDVTSPIDPDEHPLSSSGGRDSLEHDEEGNAFTKTGALTIKSSSSSSGGLVAALGLSRTNSVESSDEQSVPPVSGLLRSMSDSGLRPKSEIEPVSPHRQLGRESRDGTTGCVDVPGQGQSSQHRFTKHRHRESSATTTTNRGDHHNAAAGRHGSNRGAATAASLKTDVLTSRSDGDQQTSLFSQNQTMPQYSHFGVQAHTIPNLYNIQQQNIPPPGGASTQNVANPTPPTDSHHQVVAPALPTKGAAMSSGLNSAAQLEQAAMLESRPTDLTTLLGQLGLTKYLRVFDEQDVDLQVFLSLTDNDLKEVGIKLFGPRRKMSNAIARWHSNARPSDRNLEQAYGDKLEAEMQEMAIQLHQACDQADSLKQQVSQERELRSVTEGCLMEDRAAWQRVLHLACDTRQRCGHMQEMLLNVRQYQCELARRFGAESQSPLSGSGNRENLGAAINERLAMAELSREFPNEIARLPTQQIIRRLQSCYEELESSVAMVTMNADKLLGWEAEHPKAVRNFSPS